MGTRNDYNCQELFNILHLQACELSANSEHTSFNGQLDWKKTDVHTDKETGQAGRDGERGEGGMTGYDTKGKLCRETAATLIHSMYSCTYCLYFFNCNSIIIKWVLFSSSYAFAAFCFHPYLILFFTIIQWVLLSTLFYIKYSTLSLFLCSFYVFLCVASWVHVLSLSFCRVLLCKNVYLARF